MAASRSRRRRIPRASSTTSATPRCAPEPFSLRARPARRLRAGGIAMSLDLTLLLRRILLLAALPLAGSLGVAGSAAAQSAEFFSPDITAKLGPVVADIVTDEDAARDDGA